MEAFRVRSITVQPDRIQKLEGENNYDLLALKRAIVRCSYGTAAPEKRFTVNVDFRARLLTVDYDEDHEVLLDMASAVLVKLVLAAGNDFAWVAAMPGPGQKAQIGVRDADQALGILHALKENAPI